MNARATPSLRIAQLWVRNFRSFRDQVEIPLTSPTDPGEMPVFHGENGAGKSNAFAAVDRFFRAVSSWLIHGGGQDVMVVPSGWSDDVTGFELGRREWPPGTADAQVLEAEFADEALGLVKVAITPAGRDYHVAVTQTQAGEAAAPPDPKRIAWLRTALETPLGEGSMPFFRLDARRHDFAGFREGPAQRLAPETPLSARMARQLYGLATSLDPLDRERWRSFVALVGRFKALSGYELTIVPLQAEDGSRVDLRFEIRGKQILRLSELSSGEQQIVALCASVLTPRAAIVAIEEPETSLDEANQRLVRELLLEQVRRGIVDQVLLESHVPAFDGPEVVRFSRMADGTSAVTRQRAAVDDEVRARAIQAGADQEWVSADGYTRLPDEMRRELQLESGGYLWFLKSGKGRRWQAWTAGDLDTALGFAGEEQGR